MLWVENLQTANQKNKVMLGVEPTGPYWIPLSEFIQQSTPITLVMVNSHHTKKSKELDDNSPTKDDHKDAKTIAKLITEGRYYIPNIPTGDYAELRRRHEPSPVVTDFAYRSKRTYSYLA